MNTRQLYYLVTINDFGNLSNAAQVLDISQPALSKLLTKYEDSIGFPLFLRYHRHLTPTAVGRYVIECAQKILDEQTRMLQTLRAVTDSNHTQIRLATAPNRGAIIYSKIYNPFSQRYPNITLTLNELYASEQPGAILHGQIDLSIGSGKTSDKVTDLPIAYEELLVSLPASHPLASAERIRLADLRDTPFVLQGPRHSIRILSEELFEEAGFQPVVAFESNDVILVDSMLHQAVGAGLVSQAHVFPCEELVYRPLDPPVHQTLHIRYPLGHTLTEPERYLAGLLIRERLSDPRYKIIHSPIVEELLQFANTAVAVPEHVGGQSDFSDATVSSDTVQRTTHYTAPQINLNTQILQYIISVVDEKSLTRAAEKHYLTQPALSRHLRNIEQMFCTTLFTRVHNRLQPTNAGKILVNFSRNILQIEAEMLQYLHTYQIGHGGGIYLQCDSSLANELKEHTLSSFGTMHPNVNLAIAEGDQNSVQEALLNASADLGLYFSCKAKHPILHSKILAQSELVYCFSNIEAAQLHSFPNAYDDSKTISTLKTLLPQMPSRPIMLAPAGSTLRKEQNRLLDNLFEEPPTVVCEAQIDILQYLAQSGVADTILPIHFLSEDAAKRSCSFPILQNYYLLQVYHPSRNLPASVLDLMQLLNNTFESYFS